ncbi:histidine acid phosphatase [Thozetella sp. PMI_491]|nr:histidine acid phosphatase [Thozetella sp. PMI_491]
MELTHLLLLLPSLPLATAETVLGAYIFHRHGDRTTKSYSPTTLTALGADQVFISGSWYRDHYIKANSSSQIHGLATDIPIISQIPVTSPIDTVLQNSAQVFLQGLYPPAGAASAQKLANGTSVTSPLDGYQYVPVNAVTNAASSGSSEDSSWLQGGSGCGNALVSSNNYFSSADYLTTLASTKDFYQGLLPVYNATFPAANANFKNGYLIWDFVHVSTIHNTSIPSDDLLTTDTLFQLRTRADQHEWNLAYNASEPVRAIAGAVLAAQIVQALNTTLTAPVTKASAPKLTIQFGAYAAFMSFFGLSQANAASPNFYGVVDYASSFIVELVTNATLPTTSGATIAPADVSVRFLFVNGSASETNPPAPYALFGQKETTISWATFSSEMSKFAIGDTLDWCKACGNSTGICASASTSSGNGSATTSGSDSGSGGGISKAVAGVIGALVTLVVILAIEGLVMAVAGLRLAKKSALAKGNGATSHVESAGSK